MRALRCAPLCFLLALAVAGGATGSLPFRDGSRSAAPGTIGSETTFKRGIGGRGAGHAAGGEAGSPAPAELSEGKGPGSHKPSTTHISHRGWAGGGQGALAGGDAEGEGKGAAGAAGRADRPLPGASEGEGAGAEGARVRRRLLGTSKPPSPAKDLMDEDIIKMFKTPAEMGLGGAAPAASAKKPGGDAKKTEVKTEVKTAVKTAVKTEVKTEKAELTVEEKAELAVKGDHHPHHRHRDDVAKELAKAGEEAGKIVTGKAVPAAGKGADGLPPPMEEKKTEEAPKAEEVKVEVVPVQPVAAAAAATDAGSPDCPAAYTGPPACTTPRALPCFGKGFASKDLSVHAGMKGAPGGMPPMQFYGGTKLPFRSCAVVGSSPTLKNTAWGKEIDGHDFVMRFNNAPTRGHEKNVGSYTSMRFTNDRYHGFREKAGEAVIGRMCSPFPMNGEIKCAGFKSPALKFMLQKKMFSLNPEFDRYVMTPFRKVKATPSSGFKMLVLLLHVCNHVNVYGMLGVNSFRTWYWDKYKGFKGKPEPKILSQMYPKTLMKGWNIKHWEYATPGKKLGNFYPNKPNKVKAGKKGKAKANKGKSDHNMGFERKCLNEIKAKGMVTVK